MYLVTEDWFFASHFLGFARAAVAAGFEPVVATRVRDHRAAIEATGARVVPVDVERRSVGLVAVAATLARYRAVIAAERPRIVHCIALKPVLLGGLVARILRVPGLLLAPTGLGYLWVAAGPAAATVRTATRWFVAGVLAGSRTRFLFENRDDAVALGQDPVDERRVTVVMGAGVAPEAFPASPDPGGAPIRVAVVARMLRMKGIADAVAAVRLARGAGYDVVLDLWGAPDPGNPDAISPAELRAWSQEPGIIWHGRTDDPAAVWQRSHIALLLSHGGEGLPRALVEAAASGRPIITTDVPGCRDTVEDGQSGLRVRPHDAAAASQAIARLAADPDMRRRMGREARARFERAMTDVAVNTRVVDRYLEMLAGDSRP
jgi:glycosyltransferase involved in cell wall biosynthesis